MTESHNNITVENDASLYFYEVPNDMDLASLPNSTVSEDRDKAQEKFRNWVNSLPDESSDNESGDNDEVKIRHFVASRADVPRNDSPDNNGIGYSDQSVDLEFESPLIPFELTTKFVSLCRLNGKIGPGSGFLCQISTDVYGLLTCHHVVKEEPTESDPLHVHIEVCKPPIHFKIFKCVGKSFFTSSRDELDATFIRFTAVERAMLVSKGAAFLEVSPSVTKRDDTVFVIQHPYDTKKPYMSGGPVGKLLSSNTLSHRASADKGSSGSPLLHETDLRVVAMHKRGNLGKNWNRATPIHMIVNAIHHWLDVSSSAAADDPVMMPLPKFDEQLSTNAVDKYLKPEDQQWLNAQPSSSADVHDYPVMPLPDFDEQLSTNSVDNNNLKPAEDQQWLNASPTDSNIHEDSVMLPLADIEERFRRNMVIKLEPQDHYQFR